MPAWCPYPDCNNKVDQEDYFCEKCKRYFIKCMIKKDESRDEFDYKLWYMLGAFNYVLVRISLYYQLERHATYLMQQTIEIYLKSYILKHYNIDKCNPKKPIIHYNGKCIEFRTHNLKRLLKCCQEKDNKFKDDFFKELIEPFNDFDTIRYPSKLKIDVQIVHTIDYFVKTIRNLINPKDSEDMISHLQSSGIADMSFNIDNDLKKSFFHFPKNKQFEERKI